MKTTSETSGSAKRPLFKSVLFSFILVCVLLLFMEIIASSFVFHRYHDNISESLQTGHRSALGTMFKKLLSFRERADFIAKSADPEPYRGPDSVHGFRINPGSYVLTYRKRHFDTIQQFKFHVTVNEDGSRYVGKVPFPTERDVFVFGDSFVFGEGVNDEQTFTYLLQSRFHHTRYHLYAAGGYALHNAYLNFEKLASRIGPEDVIILGHADFYDVRHVAAPSRLKWWGQPNANKNDPRDFGHLRVRLVDDSLLFDRVPLFCAYGNGYCDQPEPSTQYMDSVTARLINGITRKTQAKVYLLHFRGPLREDITRQLDARVHIIRAASEDFDYLHRDDINGFDGHPGPYWNHSIYKRLTDTLSAFGLQ
jgi:hypothetical protein